MPDYPHDPVFHFAAHHDGMNWNPAGLDGQRVDNDMSYYLGRKVTIGELLNSPGDSGLMPPDGWIQGSEPGTAIRADLFYAGQNYLQQAQQAYQQEALRQSRAAYCPSEAEQARLARLEEADRIRRWAIYNAPPKQPQQPPAAPRPKAAPSTSVPAPPAAAPSSRSSYSATCRVCNPKVRRTRQRIGVGKTATVLIGGTIAVAGFVVFGKGADLSTTTAMGGSSAGLLLIIGLVLMLLGGGIWLAGKCSD
jgi:hypothetical protein